MDKIKNFFLGEIKALKEDLNIVEYISWWLLRFFMVGVIIYMKINDPENINIYLVTLNIHISRCCLHGTFLFCIKERNPLPFFGRGFLV